MNRPEREWRHLLLLGMLLLLLVVEPLVFGVVTAPHWFDLVFSLVVLTAILSLFQARRARWYLFGLGLLTILFSLGGHSVDGRVVLLGHVVGMLFLVSVVVLIIGSLLQQRRITLDSLFGAVCGYLLLGMAWAVLYSMTEVVMPGSFRVPEELARILCEGSDQVEVFYYFSFVTLTTLGYGDITPLSDAARAFTWTEAVAGQVYIAVVVASLVGALIANRQEQRGRGQD